MNEEIIKDCEHQCTSGCQKDFDCPCQSEHYCQNSKDKPDEQVEEKE